MAEKQEFFTLLNNEVHFVRSMYNPTSDAIWLAAFAPISHIKHVLDVGIGTGGVSLCLLSHNPMLVITGIDNSSTMLQTCQKNIELNTANIQLIQDDIYTWKTNKTFDLVISNPPYFYGTSAKHNAHHNIDLIQWTKKCLARVKPSGYFCTIVDGLVVDKIIYSLTLKHFGNIQILPLYSNKCSAERVLIRAKQGVNTGVTLYKGMFINDEKVLRVGLTIDSILTTLPNK